MAAHVAVAAPRRLPSYVVPLRHHRTTLYLRRTRRTQAHRSSAAWSEQKCCALALPRQRLRNPQQTYTRMAAPRCSLRAGRWCLWRSGRSCGRRAQQRRHSSLSYRALPAPWCRRPPGCVLAVCTAHGGCMHGTGSVPTLRLSAGVEDQHAVRLVESSLYTSPAVARAQISQELRSSASIRAPSCSGSASGEPVAAAPAGRPASLGGLVDCAPAPSTCKVVQPTPMRMRVVFGSGGNRTVAAPCSQSSARPVAVPEGDGWHDTSAVRHATQAAVAKADAAKLSAASLAHTLRSARPVPLIRSVSPAEATESAFACAVPLVQSAEARSRSPTFASMAKSRSPSPVAA